MAQRQTPSHDLRDYFLEALQHPFPRYHRDFLALLDQRGNEDHFTQNFTQNFTQRFSWNALPYTEEWDPDFDPRAGLLLLHPDGTVPTKESG